MNSNVIKFPIKNSDTLSYNNRLEHLNSCKELLTEEDYRDVLCGVMDTEFYGSLEEDLKDIVDTYFQYKC
jgi:hypothetical protein